MRGLFVISTFNYFFLNESLPHPATFIKRSLFEKVGIYNEKFQIVSDWEFWLKAIILHDASWKHIDQIISVFNLLGASSNPTNFQMMQAEKHIVYMNHFKYFVDDYMELYNLKSGLAPNNSD